MVLRSDLTSALILLARSLALICEKAVDSAIDIVLFIFSGKSIVV